MNDSTAGANANLHTLKAAAALLLTAVTLYLALIDVDLKAVAAVTAQARPVPVLLGMAAILLGWLLKIIRWHILLNAAGAPTRKAALATAFISGQFLNFVYPFRAGDISRVVAMGGASGADYISVAGTLAVEKIFDLAAFLVLITIQLALRPPAGPLPALSPVAWVVPLLLAFLLIGSIVGLPVLRRSGIYQRLPDDLRQPITNFGQRLSAGFRALRSPPAIASLVTLTGLIWFAALLPNILAWRALGLELPPSAALLVLVVLQIGISVPSLPAKIGIFEYACILALQSYGIQPDTGLSYGIVLHAIVYLPVIVLGTPAIWLAAARRSEAAPPRSLR